MVDEVDNTASEPEEPSGPLAGERLANARRELQISVLEIAKELHLDESKVRALERNEFDVLGAPVFAKGHLRKYAELVHVKAEDVLVDYYRMNRSADNMPPVVSTRPRPRRELSPGPWIAVIVVIVVVVSAWLWFSRSTPTVEETVPADTVSETVVPSTGDEEAAEMPAEDTDPDDIATPAASDEIIAPEPEVQPGIEQPVIEETESPEIAAGQMRLLLTYAGDCWTEVTDASGRRLFFALGTDGRTVELSGDESFNVLFGNPGNVAVTVNGDEYALPATARPDRPLRLTISGT
jgi:cytoskeleton protein RodZ